MKNCKRAKSNNVLSRPHGHLNILRFVSIMTWSITIRGQSAEPDYGILAIQSNGCSKQTMWQLLGNTNRTRIRLSALTFRWSEERGASQNRLRLVPQTNAVTWRLSVTRGSMGLCKRALMDIRTSSGRVVGYDIHFFGALNETAKKCHRHPDLPSRPQRPQCPKKSQCQHPAYRWCGIAPLRVYLKGLRASKAMMPSS